MATLSLNSSAPPSLQWPPNNSLSTLNTLENPNHQNPEEEEEEAADPDKSENPNYSNPNSIMEPPLDFNSSIPSISTLFPNQHPEFNSNRQPRKTPDFLLHLGFNQDAGCFSVATDLGFQVFNSDPLTETFRRDFEGGGIGMVEMLFRSNIFALVGGGPNPLYPTTKVMLWEDDKDRFMAELSFRAPVKSVRLRRDWIVVVLEQKVYVYSFFDLRLLHQIDTMPNPKGLCAVSQSATGPMLVCPGLQKGQIRIENYGTRRTKLVMAHDSELACIAMSLEGNWVATASKKGTLIRIFNTKDGSLLQEVRRGADKADIYSLAFSPTAKWLAVSSDKGTIHVFSLKGNQEGEGEQNSPTSTAEVSPATSSGPSFNGPLFFIRGVLPKYFSSEWSLAQFRLPEGVQSIVAFGHQKHTIMILGFDGSFYRCKFDPVAGGEMTQLEFHNFLKREEASS